MMEGGEEESLRLGEGVEFVEPTKRLQVGHVYTYVEIAQNKLTMVLGVLPNLRAMSVTLT